MVGDTASAEPDNESDPRTQVPLPKWHESRSRSKKTISLAFSNLSYFARRGFTKGKCQVLHNVSGELLTGELTAIMGPSGAGKSSLMNILAGFTTRGVTGSITINGKERDLDNFHKYSCYIMQDDQLQPLLTVGEAMNMAAQLKRGGMYSSEVRKSHVDIILHDLGLSDSSKTRTESLSGGQRKRLAIALELISNPPIMFFDEPTSGLDSSSSWQCVKLLKTLAEGGRTVVCTIHQPSASLLEKFDKLYAIADGKCMYQGRTNDLLPRLAEHHFACPSYHNPADFLLEVLVGEHGPTNSLLDEEPVTEKKISKHSNLDSNMKGPEKMARQDSCVPTVDDYHTPFMLQLKVLIRRNYTVYLRDQFLIRMNVLMHLFIGILIGALYYNIGKDAAYTRDNFGFLYFCIMFIQFTAFSSKILSFPLEFPILLRENFNGWYSLRPYVLASIAVDAPVQLVSTLCYTLVSYYLTSQPMELHRIFLFFIVCLLVGLVSQTIGVLIGLTMGIKNGMVFGPLAILPFLIFSGFFVSMKDASRYFEWLFHISYLKYALEAIMQATYSYNREKLPCSAVYCHYKVPQKLLEELGMSDARYWVDITFLVTLYLILLVIIYGVLRVKLYLR